MLSLNDNSTTNVSTKRVHRILNFACMNNKALNVESLNETVKNFSKMNNAREDYLSGLTNFALMDYIKEYNMSPRMIFQKRVKEVIDYVNSKGKSDILKVRSILLSYLNNFMYEQIMRLLDSGGLNIAVSLGLGDYLGDLNSVKELQVSIQRAYDTLESGGTMNSQIQNDIRDKYSKLWTDLLMSIDERFINPDKKGLILGG